MNKDNREECEWIIGEQCLLTDCDIIISVQEYYTEHRKAHNCLFCGKPIKIKGDK